MHSKNLNIAITLLTALAMGCGDDSNSPNKCSEGQVWNAETGKCDPLVTSECTTNDDCKDGKVCKDGACQAEHPLVECTSNDDCKDGKVCKDGACKDSQPIDKCTSNDDCQDGKVCNSGHCETAQPVECQTDDDCNGDLVCKLGKCEPECSQDDDCETPQICRDTRCILECTTDDECDNNLVCRDNRCAPQCQTSEDCNEPLVCRDNACQPECQNDDDCDGGLVCKENKCTEECQNDDDCDDGLVCKENKCTEECQNDDDCDGDLICVDKRCKIECEKKEDCQEGFVCSEQKCIPACISDSDCDESYLCQDEICIKDPLWCSFDSDCESGFYCDKNHCYDPNNQCSQDEDCTDPLVCKENKCVPECKVNADCTDNLVCKSQRCKPECTTNAECTAPKYCKDMRCTKSCSKDSDCLPPYICIDNQCAHECEKTSDCTNDLICSNYRCVACASDSDCGPEQVCNLNVCEISKDIRYPCLPEGNSFKVYKTDSGYNAAQNIDGSINLCKLGYHPSENEILADPSKDKCIALYEARPYDFYGDGIDSNCDGYDYNLKNAIFVASQAQGSEAGDDTHSGNYNQEQNIIEAKATIQSALTHSNVAINVSGTMLTYLPDILVDKSVTSNLANTLQISVTSAQDLNILPPLKAISSAPNKTAYSEHSILVKEVSTDPSKTISDYGFYTEGNHPKERIRIFGGLTRNPLNNSNYHHWQHLNSEDTSKQSYQIPEITEDSYVLVQSVSISTPLSLALSDFEMSLSAKGKSKPEGTTLVGLSCGKAGCISLNLNHTTWTITAPDGISQSGTPDAGEDGYAGKNGNHDEDNTNLYIDSTWCPNEQICSGTTATGTGGCGGHIRKTNKENGDSSSNYDGASLNYIGKTGQAGLSVLSASSVILAAGGKGGAGLTSAGISYKGCNSNMSVDESKGTGEKGGDGAGGKNGSHKNLELTLTPTSDSLAMYFKSNYDSNTEIYGGDGAQGGGGGGGSVYQIHSAMTQNPAWISAGSGGNGGCGGKGGLPGGTGGSAIGLIVLPPQSVNAKISLDNTAFHVIAGSGGKAQNGSDGGKGGAGGSNMGYAKENAISTDIYCEKATAGGDGGNGGGGGAGAGGVAGRALSYLFACNRKVTDDCSLATTSKPCFNATNRTTFANCGIELPMKFVAVYDDSAFGSATPGKTMDDSSETVTQSGGIAGTTQTDGYYRFLTTWIGNL